MAITGMLIKQAFPDHSILSTGVPCESQLLNVTPFFNWNACSSLLLAGTITVVCCNRYAYISSKIILLFSIFFGCVILVNDWITCHISTGGTALPIATYCRFSETESNSKFLGKD